MSVADDLQRVVLLNWLASRSVTRARSAIPPTRSAAELFSILEKRYQRDVAIEFLKGKDHNIEEERRKLNRNSSYTRIADIRMSQTSTFRYAHILFKHVDMRLRSFSVENTSSRIGRDVEGDADERGTTSAHLIARLPLNETQLEDGKYRCVLESVSPLSRTHLEFFLCRQLRRQADSEEWTFSEIVQKSSRSKPIEKEYQYTSKLELMGDVGRALSDQSAGQRQLSSMVFTKRDERQTIGRAIDVDTEEFTASVQIKVLATQGPDGEAEKKSWASKVRDHFTSKGYDAKLYFRHVNGGTVGGGVHEAVNGAFDIVMCPREIITLSSAVRSSSSTLNDEVCEGLKTIVDNDELWERSK